MKKRAGIFDPWRQEKPPAPAGPTLAQPVGEQQDSVEGGSIPTRFPARRGGLVVWLPEGEPDQINAQAKTNILVALEKLMADRELFTIFNNWGISTSAIVRDTYTKISDGPRSVYVTGDYEAAIEAITFAFREASRSKPSVEKYLTSLGIRPYIR